MSRLAPQQFDASAAAQLVTAPLLRADNAHAADAPPIPHYLNEVYWWAYVDPRAVRFFERQWMVNLILWGNYNRLRTAALESLGDVLPGRTLQVACAYGDFPVQLAERVQKSGGDLDVVDVLPVQLQNLRRKLPSDSNARLLHMDAGDLHIADATYDRTVLFFLLHEEPEDYRRRTLAEAFRVTKPGGQILIVDYAGPKWWNPWRYWFRPFLALLEPYALDLWRAEVASFMPEPWKSAPKERKSYFGGLYQKIVMTR